MALLPPLTLGLPLIAHYSLPLITCLFPALYLEMLESFPERYNQKGHFYFQNIQLN